MESQGKKIHKNTLFNLTLILMNLDMSCLYKQYRSRSEEEANWSGSPLFIIKYVNLYQQHRSSNMNDWKLEVGVALHYLSLCEFALTTWVKLSDWLTIRSGCGILIYLVWQGNGYTCKGSALLVNTYNVIISTLRKFSGWQVYFFLLLQKTGLTIHANFLSCMKCQTFFLRKIIQTVIWWNFYPAC